MVKGVQTTREKEGRFLKRHRIKEIREETIHAVRSGKVRDIRERAREIVTNLKRKDVWELIHIFKDEENWKLRSLVAEILKEISSKDIIFKLKNFVRKEEDWRVNESYQMALSTCLEESSKKEFVEEIRPIFMNWIKNTGEKVKRMIVEGSRPRKRIQWLHANPKVIISLLKKLREDESNYVRTALANNLKDIGREHPQLLVETLKEWLKETQTPETKSIIIKALEKVIKDNYKLAEPMLKNLAKEENKRIANMAKRRLK